MGVLYATGRLTFALFMLLCLSSSAVFGLLDGTSNAALITVVGPERYAQAESLNQGRDAAVRMSGSPLGATLYGLWSPAPFLASAVCDAAAFVCAFFLHLPERPETKQANAGVGAFIHDLVEG
jgi:predicted MFS family arabinose efflux permease